jgi:hypothetical protein
MNAQAYDGYFKDGHFYSAGRTIEIPEEQRVRIMIYEPTADNDSLADTLREAREQAKINGTFGMTLDEINDVIAD